MPRRIARSRGPSTGTSERWARPAPPILGAGADLGDGAAGLGPIARGRRGARAGRRLGDAADPADSAPRPDDLAAGLRRLGGCAVAVLALLAVAWIWDLDLALVRFLLNQPLWFVDDQTPVTVGDVAEAGGDHPGRGRWPGGT